MTYTPQESQPDLLAGFQRPLPNATAVLVLGILSIVLCFICGIIALSLASSDTKRYEAHPGIYTAASFEMLRTGRICAIIGLCLWGVAILFYVVVFVFLIGVTAVNS